MTPIKIKLWGKNLSSSQTYSDGSSKLIAWWFMTWKWSFQINGLVGQWCNMMWIPLSAHKCCGDFNVCARWRAIKLGTIGLDPQNMRTEEAVSHVLKNSYLHLNINMTLAKTQTNDCWVATIDKLDQQDKLNHPVLVSSDIWMTSSIQDSSDTCNSIDV